MEDWLRTTNWSPDALKTWTSHPDYDAYWRERDLTGRYDRAHAAAVHVGGWYDIFSQGTIDAFTGFQAQGGVGARGRQHLLIGLMDARRAAGARRRPYLPRRKQPAGRIRDAWKWFDFALKGERNEAAAAPAVTYYVMGDTADPAGARQHLAHR